MCCSKEKITVTLQLAWKALLLIQKLLVQIFLCALNQSLNIEEKILWFQFSPVALDQIFIPLFSFTQQMIWVQWGVSHPKGIRFRWLFQRVYGRILEWTFPTKSFPLQIENHATAWVSLHVALQTSNEILAFCVQKFPLGWVVWNRGWLIHRNSNIQSNILEWIQEKSHFSLCPRQPQSLC